MINLIGFIFMIAIQIHRSIFCLEIQPIGLEHKIKANESIVLICQHTSPIQWSYPETVSRKIVENTVKNDMYFSTLRIESAYFMDTGYYICKSYYSEKSETYVYVFDEKNLIALESELIVINGEVNEDILVPCKPTSPMVQTHLMEFEEVEIRNETFNIREGYIFNQNSVSSSFYQCCGRYKASNLKICRHRIWLIISDQMLKVSIPRINDIGPDPLYPGDNVTLNCSVDVFHKVNPAIKWTFPGKNKNQKIINESHTDEFHKDYRKINFILKKYNLTKSDQGLYTCEVKNQNNSRATYFLNIYDEELISVNISVENSQISVKVGEPFVELKAFVNGSSNPSITWYDSKRKKITTNSSRNQKYFITFSGQLMILRINNITIRDYGTYYLTASNKNIIKSQNFTLLVTAAPTAVLKTDSEFYWANEIHEIDCFSTGYPRPKIIWFFKICSMFPHCGNTTYEEVLPDLYSEKVIEPYQVKSTYRFQSNVTTHIICEAENRDDFATVFQLCPVIDKNSTFLNMFVVDNKHEIKVPAREPQIEWVINITATPSPTITWFDTRGIKIASSLKSKKFFVTQEREFTKLKISNISIWDFGTYRVMASNEHYTKSINLTLVVEDSPFVELKNNLKCYQANKIYSIECVSTGYPLSRIVWFTKTCDMYPECENKTYEEVPNYLYDEKALGPYQLTSTYKFKAKETMYLKCKSDSSISVRSSLVTDMPNEFFIAINLDSIATGDDVVIDCGVSKYNYFKNISWYQKKSNNLVPIANTSETYLVFSQTYFSHHLKLLISNIQENHTGNYVCKASSLEVPETMTKTVYVEIKSDSTPLIKYTNMNQTTLRTQIGKILLLNCSVEGVPTPIIFWFKNGHPLEMNSSESRVQLHNNNQTLQITFIILSDQGRYSVMVINRRGNITDYFDLIVAGDIEEIENLGLIVTGFVLIASCIFCFMWFHFHKVKVKKSEDALKFISLLVMKDNDNTK